MCAVAEWFSIEVIDGSSSGRLWADAHGDELIWLAQGHGATDWHWEHHSWGVVLELELPDELALDAFLGTAGVAAALDATPSPAGALTYRGRGGSSGARQPRRPRPIVGAGAAALPIPEEPEEWRDDVAPVLLLA